jgi:hypothetical protein
MLVKNERKAIRPGGSIRIGVKDGFLDLLFCERRF